MARKHRPDIQAHLRSKTMTIREVSAYLRVSKGTIYRLLKQNRIPGFRIGSDWRFNVEEIDRWRLKHTVRDE